MGCVNRNGKEFKALAARNNVAINTLELITHKYWLETGNETKFPTDIYIQAQLGNVHYLEKGPNVRKLWGLRYNSPKEFSSMRTLQSAIREAEKYFPKSAILYYKNSKGNYILSVKRPVAKEDYSKDEFFKEYDKAGSVRDIKILHLGLKEGQTYGIGKVQELFNKFNTDKTTKDLADRAFNLAKDLGLKISFTDNFERFGVIGQYKDDNTIKYKKSFLERDTMNDKKAPLLLHEVLHALSMYALSDRSKNWKKPEVIENFRTEINSLYNELKGNEALKGERGVVNVYEFVAELSNPIFREKIKSIDRNVTADKALEKKSFWRRIIDAFKNLLGLHVTNSYYQRSMNALETALDAFDIDTYMRYNGIKNLLRQGYNAKDWEFNSMSDAEVKSNVSNYFDKKVYNAELQSLKEKAIANGTFMKAPNGKDTKLTERQWLQVRTKAFKDWFGDWENNPKEASKIVDENGEPLVVYHGGAQDIRVFHHSSEKESNTGYGFYTDPKTGEKIPLDSNNAIFFSSNPFVGTSYATMYGIQYFQHMYSQIEDTLFNSTKEEGLHFTRDHFEHGINDFYEFLTNAAEINPRFQALKNYIQRLKQEGKTITKENEREEILKMLRELRSRIQDFTSEYLMNRSEWENVYSRAKEVINTYNNPDGIEKLLKGEIPETLQREWEIYKKIQSQRKKEGLDETANYEEVHLTLGKNRYYLIYDGKDLSIWNPEYTDPKVTDMTREELSKFLSEAKQSNQVGIEDLKNDTAYQTVKGKAQEYSVFLNVRNPLTHDYEGTHQGQGYKQSKKYPFGYVAARQVNKAIKEGNDGVVYKNLYDPYLANNYGVFDSYQIKSATDNTGEFSTTNPEIQNYELAKEVTDSMSGEQLKNELSLIQHESADYDMLNGIEEKPKHSGKAIPQDFTFADGTTIKAPFRPNAQQVDALNAMDRFMKSDETSMTLSGYAGTGKTSLMEMIAKKSKMLYRPVIFCASTNKAAAVLNERVRKSGFKAETLHKIFGIQVAQDEKSLYYNTKNLKNSVKRLEDINIEHGTTVIIDEASMINEENYDILNKVAKAKNLKIIYVGDEAQLAPVGEDKISKVFRNGEGKVIRLTQVERTDDNAILKEATDIRNGKPLSGESSFNSKGEGVAYITPSNHDTVDEVIGHYAKGLKDNPNHFRILAFTNKAVSEYNNKVREILGYTTPAPVEGEPMTGYANLRYDWITKTYEFVNSESYKVYRSYPAKKKSIRIDGVTYTMEAYPIDLEDPVGHIVSFDYMDIKNNESNREAAKAIGKKKKELWVAWKKATTKAAKSKALSDIHTLEEFLFVNDEIKDEKNIDPETGQHPTLVDKAIDFGYAMTVHKSQGSTFTNVLIDDIDIARGTRNKSNNPMDNAMAVVDLGIESNNDPSKAEMTSSEDVDLVIPDDVPIEAKKSDNEAADLKQQLEYVAVSRATDTVTVISNNVKKEGSPLHPESAIKEKEDKVKETPKNTILKQLISPLKSSGAKVYGRAAMAEYLKTHKLEYLQQYIDKHNLPKGELPVLSEALMNKYGNKTAYGDVICTANYEYTVNYKGAKEFDIIEYHKIDNNINTKIDDTERKGVSGTIDRMSIRDEITEREYPCSSYDVKDGETNGDYAELDKTTLQGESKQTEGNVSSQQHQEWTAIKRDSETGRVIFIDGDGRTISTAEDWNFPLFTTPQGEVYGFVDKEGNIYLDETKISPEHPIHEYTHLWDRTVQQKNPKLWQRGVELMKQTSLWNEILNDEHYGKIWQSMNLSKEKMDNLIASEVHARFTGEGGEALLNKLAKEKGQSGIIAKLKQWILDVWKDLKTTFGNWSQEDLDNLTLKDFNHMTVRDFTEGINLKDVANATYTTQQKQQVDWARTSSNGYEVSTRGDRRFSALVATFKPGTIIDGVDVGGKTIEHVYQNVIKKSGKGKAPAKDSKLYNESLKTNEEREDFSYQKGYLPLWKEWAKQNPELMAELKEKSQGKVLTDQFANTRVSQARALAEILNESKVKDSTQDTTVENPSIAEGKSQMVNLPNYQQFNELYDKVPVDAEWKVSYLKELDAQIDAEKSQEEKQNLIDQMNNVLHATSESEYKQEANSTKEKEIKKTLDNYEKLTQQLNRLLEGDEDLEELKCPLSATEVRHTAELVANYISDLITQLQQERGLAEEQYPSLKTELDFQKASRKEIVETVGVNRLIERAKELFNSDKNELGGNYNTMDQADVIYDCWDAIMYLAADVFAMNEGFGITCDFAKGLFTTTDKVSIDYDNFNNYENDKDVIGENEKDEQEHWQIESRCIDVLNSMSALVRKGLHECYLLNEDGSKVMSKWGIPERVNPRDSVNSILRWTQGSRSLDDMIKKLSAKQKHNTWLSQLITRLSDTSGEETDFQSQFYNVFSKAFQNYSIVLLEDGKYHSIPVNSHPALTEAIDSIKAQFKAERLSLFNAHKINMELLGSKDTVDSKDFNLYKAYNELLNAAKSIPQGEGFDEKTLKVVADNVVGVCRLLGYNITEDFVDELTPQNVLKMATALEYMHKKLVHANKELTSGEIKSYDAFKYKGEDSIDGNVRNFLFPITEKLEDTAVNAFYDSGKMYQSYVTPSFLTNLMNKFKLEGDEFRKFIEDTYASSEWFKLPMKNGKEGKWRNAWLSFLGRGRGKNVFDHKVELNFNKHNYMRNMSAPEYALSLITEYFSVNSDANENMAEAWFRVPMQSNKPSSDFIKFYSWRGEKYKKTITGYLHDTYLQEVSRIQTVRMRNLDKHDSAFIKNFDSNGLKFNFLPALNAYLEDTDIAKSKRKVLRNEDGSVSADNNRCAELLQQLVKGEKELTSDEGAELNRLIDDVIEKSTEDRVQSILDKWERGGILEAAKSIKDIYPSSYNQDLQKAQKTKDTEKIKAAEDKIKNHIRAQVENFLWNDYLASQNILQLTITDIAFYKDAEDLQKRLSQLHAPGNRGNINATDYKGNRVSDGKYRTFILKDFDDFRSNIIDNISEVFDRKIAAAKDPVAKKTLTDLKDSLVRKPGTIDKDDKGGKYWNINVTDAQGYCSPSSYRKKALIFGRWSKDSEKIYQKLLNDEANYEELEKAFQPLKPFVYTKLTKNMGVDNAPITSMQVPFQAKNSEYLLIMADAILKGEKLSRPNLLRAVFRVMEESERLCPTKGIDTVQFESAIKSGLQGAIDITQYRDMEGGEEAAYTFMMNQIFKEEYKKDDSGVNVVDADGNNIRDYKTYNTDVFVAETSYDDYCLQQEVPEHFKDHEQSHGSQIRMITPSDLDLYTYDENGNQVDNYYEWTEPDGTVKRMKADEFRKEYEETIAENIAESIAELKAELHLDSGSRKEKNIALSKILQREILSSPRYGVDLVQACSIDKETGEFRIPKGDPIQAKRIEQLINSIIKNRVNKQKIAGGPIVQVSNFGTSQQLHIRFKDKSQKDGLIPLKEDYVPSEHNGMSYKEYIKKNQGGIAYFEVYAPCPSKEIYDKFSNPDGTINFEALEATCPELLKMVSYRIPTEDKYSCAPMKVVGFMPREAGDAIMFPYELTEIDDSDFDIDKRYVMRKTFPPLKGKEQIRVKRRGEIQKELFNRACESYKAAHNGQINKSWIGTQVNMFLDNPQRMKNTDDFMRSLYKEYQSIAYYIEAPTSGRAYRDNKIVDMTYAVLTNEMTADKILNPGGFDAPKKMGYMVAAYKSDTNNLSWEELQGKSTDELKKLSYTDKDLAFADTQVQFYKQNSAASSLIGVFAVNKVAHATLESNNIWLDVTKTCGDEPFNIGGHYEQVYNPETKEYEKKIVGGKTFEGRMKVDTRYDSNGNLIGKTLGSLVSASADAVKDPILNLMNVNMTTAGMLNTMLRLGMTFDDAALFLSQDVIERMLGHFNKKNLDNYVSLDKIIEEWMQAYREEHHISDDSVINTQPLTKEELIEGLTSKEHDAIDYKVLLAYQKLKNLTKDMRNLTFTTRFNSISSAVGPLIIDNIILRHKMDKFLEENCDDGTHFYQDEHEDIPVDMTDVFTDHPILKQFAETVKIAEQLFSDMPAGCDDFKKILKKIPKDISEKVYGDKKLLDELSNFYQSYLLIQSGVINPEKLGYYINEFPKEFMKKKSDKEYASNELIKAIKFSVNKSGKPFLTIRITGVDEQVKERLRSAWIDLHKKDPALSQDLFNYSFFVAGIGFSPKTFMSLVPIFVKERLKSEDGSASYIDTYRHFPSIIPDIVVDQFIRNHWDNNKLVPWRTLEKKGVTQYVIDYNSNTLKGATASATNDLTGLSYFKLKVGNKVLLLSKKEGSESEFEIVKPLGNNGEYLEMSLSKDKKTALSDTPQVTENNTTSELKTDSPAESDSNDTSETSTVTTTQTTKAFDEFISALMKKNPEYDREVAVDLTLNRIRGHESLYGGVIQKVYEHGGMQLARKEAISKYKEMMEEFEKMC